MPDGEPKYDVAISFLYQDINLGQALYDELRKGLEVFFFPRNQEELAGSDGIESMREPFRHDSRLNVVLYRPKWGKTPWTGVEEAAVKDSCLATGFKSLFFFVVEPKPEFPIWLPETHVRFNYADFGLDQAVGAIKARVQERGGHFRPLTPLKRAEVLRAEEEFRGRRSYMLSGQSIRAIRSEVRSLFEEVCRQCDEVNSGGAFDIQHQIEWQDGDMYQNCKLQADRIGLWLTWFQRYANVLDDAALHIRQYDGPIIMPPGHFRAIEPEILKQSKYIPDVSRALDYGWRADREGNSLRNTRDFAAQCVIDFLDLIERDRSGKIKRKGWI